MDLYSSPHSPRLNKKAAPSKERAANPGWGEYMMKKNASKKMEKECCSPMYCHPHGRGKALINVAVGLLLILFGFGYIKDLPTLAMVLGVLYMLRGSIRLIGDF